jgi:hypothetical protein
VSLLGVHLTLLIGPTVAVPAPLLLTQRLESVEVTHTDEGRSGFQLVFQSGRSGPLDLLEDPLLASPLLKTFNRVILIVIFNVRPRVLMDGIITHQELSPSETPGMSKLTVTGEDVSVMMDLEERSVEHPAQPDLAIVAALIARYAKYGMVPVIVPPKVIDPPLPIERVPVQRSTDLAYIEELARRNGHVFYVTAGPAPFTNTAYWGPPKRVSVPQPALTVNASSATNVDSISFRQDAMAPELVNGEVEDRRTNRKLPVRTVASLRVPLSTQPNWLVNRANTRQVLFDESAPSFVSAYGRAQARTDLSTDRTVTASGSLDAARYGDVLTARGLVGLRGAGYSYDGLYYVQQVSHSIKRGAYTQSFTLTRDGLGSTVPVVRP